MAPVIPAIVAAAGPAFAVGTTLNAIGTLAVSFGATYLLGYLLAKPDELGSVTPIGGARLDLQIDPLAPRTLIFGKAVTAGSLVHADTYGKRGSIDNSDMIAFIAIADHPCEELLDVLVSGKKELYVENTGDDPGGTREGFRIRDYENSLFFKFYDGTQTDADNLGVVKLSGHSMPWTEDMVGQGVCYARVHAIYHQTLVTGVPEFQFVVKGIKLYDPRKDSSVGGSGAQRFNNLTTHSWTDNPMVIAYNILRGIYVKDGNGDRKHFYGFERTEEEQLPLDEWFAAMNACDEPIGQGNVERYRAGGEVSVSTEPREVLIELLKCCGGRIEEFGGVYKPYIGVPDLPVLSFTDDDILDEDEQFLPVLPLEQRVNYVTGSYTSPNRWSEKVAPPREDPDFEAEDGRRLPFDLNAPMVQHGPQMQMLMRQYLKRARRARRHKLSLPPFAFRCEPGQTVTWNSTRNGYIDKLFLIEGIEYHSNLCISLSLLEVVPADYDWSDDLELEESDEDLLPTIPSAKEVDGFSAEGVIELGDESTKKPAIKLTWDAPEDADIFQVTFQVRRPTTPNNVQTGRSDEPEVGSVIIASGLDSLTNYEVRARFDSVNGYQTAWSEWIPVTTPDAKLGTKNFEDALRHELETGINGRIQSVQESLDQLAILQAELAAGTNLDIQELTQQLINTRNEITAAYTALVQAAVGEGSAIAQAIESLEAQVADVNASASAKFTVAATPASAIAAYELMLTAQAARAGMRLIARSVAGQPVGEIWFDADHFMIGKVGEDGTFKSPFVASIVDGQSKILIDAEMVVLSLKAGRAFIGHLSALTADLGKVTAGEIEFISADGLGKLSITSNPPRLVISEWVN